MSCGTTLTGDQYLHCERTRNRLHADFGGLAIEMEGGALAQVCESFSVPSAGHPRVVRPGRRRLGAGLQSVCQSGRGQLSPHLAAIAGGAGLSYRPAAAWSRSRSRARDARRFAALPQAFTLCHTPLLCFERS